MNADFIIDSIAQNGVQDCDVLDYETDGLLYCGHCDTPKQCRIDIAGKVRIVKCQCLWVSGAAMILAAMAGTAEMTYECVVAGFVALVALLYGLA